ncbi:MAG TPA: hypothetical protein VI197_29360 [Polyangiaceae bacterium]
MSFPYGTYTPMGEVVEDRGDLGRGGERIIRVRMDLGDDTEPLFIEIPVRVASVASVR